MSKIVQIKIFNDILDQFFDFLESNFKLFKSDIMITRSGVEFLRKGNPRMVVEQFMANVSPYKNQIYECNENFFMDFENNLKHHLDDENILVGMRIKNMWNSPNITETQKAYIWLYFQKLLKAGEKVVF
jgi:hypothetical protein